MHKPTHPKVLNKQAHRDTVKFSEAFQTKEAEEFSSILIQAEPVLSEVGMQYCNFPLSPHLPDEDNLLIRKRETLKEAKTSKQDHLLILKDKHDLCMLLTLKEAISG